MEQKEHERLIAEIRRDLDRYEDGVKDKCEREIEQLESKMEAEFEKEKD